jgi:glycosyltransferase involved in cell wall biosynthesis
MTSLVSVVIPAHNAESTIGDTLKSLRQLDYPTHLIEIIVVNDGSTDGTEAVIAGVLSEFPASDWTILRQEQLGPSSARNKGWLHAKGEWIQFLDADDVLAPNKLAVQMAVAASANPSVAVIYSPWANSSSMLDGRWTVKEPLRRPRVNDDALLDLLKAENFIATGSQLFRKTWLQRANGFDERLRFIEDVELALRIAMAGGQFIDAPSESPLFFYRERAGSLSRSDPLQFREACVRNAEMVERYWWKCQQGLNPEQRAILLEVYGNALRTFFLCDRRRFFELLKHVRELKPDYHPDGSPTLRVLSHLFGYPIAEAIAVVYRKIRYRAVA